MKTVIVSARSKTLNELLKMARRTDLILQSVDGTQFVLARVRDSLAFYVGNSDDFDTEIAATRKNRKLMKFLNKRVTKAKAGRGIPLAEVRRQLGLQGKPES